jgi:hypothetical protein
LPQRRVRIPVWPSTAPNRPSNASCKCRGAWRQVRHWHPNQALTTAIRTGHAPGKFTLDRTSAAISRQAFLPESAVGSGGTAIGGRDEMLFGDGIRERKGNGPWKGGSEENAKGSEQAGHEFAGLRAPRLRKDGCSWRPRIPSRFGRARKSDNALC